MREKRGRDRHRFSWINGMMMMRGRERSHSRSKERRGGALSLFFRRGNVESTSSRGMNSLVVVVRATEAPSTSVWLFYSILRIRPRIFILSLSLPVCLAVCRETGDPATSLLQSPLLLPRFLSFFICCSFFIPSLPSSLQRHRKRRSSSSWGSRGLQPTDDSKVCTFW